MAAYRQGELWPPVKTAEGIAEMRQRRRGLSQRQRTMLLLVDGRRSVMQVKQIAVQAGAPDHCFDELLELGLIELPEPVSSQAAMARTQPDSAPVKPEPSPIPESAAHEPESAALEPESGALDLEPWEPEAVCPEPEPALKVQAMLAEHIQLHEATVAPNPDEFDAKAYAGDAFSVMQADVSEPAMPARRPAPTTESGVVDSLMSSLFPFVESAFGLPARVSSNTPRDDALEEARHVLMREVRAKAPVAGALTLMRLRRAQSREDLIALFDEVDSHLCTLMRHLSARQTLIHVRELLKRPM
jgi:hypothetical protein